jgi:hypothetical protein
MTRYSALPLVLFVAGCAQAADKTLERTFTVSPGGTLIVDADSASVEVSGGNANQVSVRMTANGSDSDLADIKLEAFQKGDEVNIVMRRGKQSWFGHSWSGDGRIRVTVPPQFTVSVQTGGGNVELAGTVGSAKLHTSGGDIAVKNVTGNVLARTSGGGIRADTVRGDVDADTSGGDVQLLNVDGKIRGSTSGGNVECGLVGANRGIKASTSGGSIRLVLPRATNASFEASTSGGQFTSEIPISTTKNDNGNAKGSINGGGELIDAHTSGGDITFVAAN